MMKLVPVFPGLNKSSLFNYWLVLQFKKCGSNHTVRGKILRNNR
jgi:hypothetical protein